MTDLFLTKVVNNIQSSYSEYRDCISELNELASLIQHIRWVERVANRGLGMGVDSERLREAATFARDKLSNVLTEKGHTDFDKRIGYEFETITSALVRQVRVIDSKIFPPESQSTEASNFVPPVIQRTSKRLSEKVLNVITKGTKYRGYTSMASWQRSKYNRRITFIVIAWMFALSGLFVSFTFLTRDFINASQNLAIKVERSDASPMRLPAITICSDDFSIPSFQNYPTAQYPGLPLFLVSMYIRSNRTIKQPIGEIRFPDTITGRSDSPGEVVNVADDITKCKEPGFDLERESKSLSMLSLLGSFSSGGNTTACRYCFRVGKKTKEILKPFSSRGSVASFRPAIQVVASKSRLFLVCQTIFMANSLQTEVLLSVEIYNHARQLESRGILDFNGYNYSVLLSAVRTRGSYRFSEFFCNIYFFSGYFYPALHEVNISYRYTGKLPYLFEKTGSGPYFNPYLWNKSAKMTAGPSREAIEKDTYGLTGIRLYVEDPEKAQPAIVPPKTEFAILGLRDVFSTFVFRRMEIMGNIEYRSKKVMSHEALIRAQYVDHFHLGFDFDLFETERVFTYSTMSWSEYVTDLFEFMGLFTGICIFTLIVAPASRVKRDSDED